MRANRLRRSRRAFTMVELMIGVGVMSLIMLAVAGLQYYSAKQIQQLYAQTRGRGGTSMVLDQLRTRLSNARNIAGAVTISNSSHRIVFRDPNLAASTAFEYRDHATIPNAKALYYEGVGGNPLAVTVAPQVNGPYGLTRTGVYDVTFAAVTSGGVTTGVKATVKCRDLLPEGKISESQKTVMIQLRNSF